jgi:hypothetical protein
MDVTLITTVAFREDEEKGPQNSHQLWKSRPQSVTAGVNHFKCGVK